MKFTYLGHSCFLLETKGKTILFDPFISGNPLAKDVDKDKIDCDYIFVSHGHQDHILDLVDIAKRTGALVVGSWELGSYLEENGVKKHHTMNNGGSFNFDIGEVYMTTAVHSNSFQGRYLGTAAGFVIKNDEHCFYYAGDTALTMDMKLFALRYNIQTAVLPIGGNFTMDYKDACIASDFIECEQIIGVHYNTFPPIKLDKDKALKHFEDAGKSLQLLKINEVKELN